MNHSCELYDVHNHKLKQQHQSNRLNLATKIHLSQPATENTHISSK